MSKRTYAIILVLLILFILGGFTYMILDSNKTYFKNEYIGVHGEKIYIPKHSYYVSECCMTAATFYSLRSKNDLEKDINRYLKGFEYFEDDTTYGYQKGDLFIQSYNVEDKGFYRQIVIVY